MPGKHMSQDAGASKKPETSASRHAAHAAKPTPSHAAAPAAGQAAAKSTPSHAATPAAGQAATKTTAQTKQSAVVAPEPAAPLRSKATRRNSDDRRSAAKSKKRNARHLASNILIVLGVVLLLVAGGMWGFAQYRYHVQEKVNAEAQQYVTISDGTETEDPNKPPVVDWAGLKAINDDVVGWIYVPGTVVNYPVYQGVDNDQYLRHTARGDWSIGGQVFLDYVNTAPGLVEQQTIIYGHHLEDGTMFQPISRLDNQEVFDATNTIWYVTENANYELEPLLVYLTEADDTNVRVFSFNSDDEFQAYLNGLLEKSVTRRQDAAEIITLVDHVFTLSTCNYYNGIGRTETVCVLKSEVDAARTAAAATPATEEPAEESAEEGVQEEEETWTEDAEY